MGNTMSEPIKAVGSTRATLFQRALPAEYRAELGAMVAEAPAAGRRATASLLLFRVGDVRLAIATRLAWAIAPVLRVARVPHRSGTVLIGLAAFRGEILPCCSLARLLDLDLAGGVSARTLILEESPGRRWAVPVDAALGVRVVEEQTREHEGTTLDPSWVSGEYADDEGHFYLLDHEILFRQINLATA